ncbi:hypothetical protein L6452_39506 [Arctium lappa]|uniref:Uncharacterized protein n=1 Tax=Arctium lappa TaxID=4217 RepID=A0ACB8XTN4_ARCLA|nr:hypothetical protein L6452_39506 [Arctium lappa]
MMIRYEPHLALNSAFSWRLMGSARHQNHVQISNPRLTYPYSGNSKNFGSANAYPFVNADSGLKIKFRFQFLLLINSLLSRKLHPQSLLYGCDLLQLEEIWTEQIEEVVALIRCYITTSSGKLLVMVLSVR